MKFIILVNQEVETMEELKPAEIIKELKNIRSSIDRFLDNLERSLKVDSKTIQAQKEG